MLVLGDQGGYALPGFIDDNWGLGGSAGDTVDVGSAKVVRLRTRGTNWKVVVETSDWTGVVRENSLGCQERVEGLNWSALQRGRSPLDRSQRPQGFTLDRSGNMMGSVVDCVMFDGLDWLYWLDGLQGLYKFYWLYRLDWLDVFGMMSMLSLRLRLGMMCSVCGMLSMLSMMSSMSSSMLSVMSFMRGRMLLAMVGVVVVMVITVRRHQRHHH